MMQALPPWLVALINPQMMPLMCFRNRVISQIQAIQNGKTGDDKTSDHPTIFHELLSSSLPPAEKSFERLVDEGETFVGAGTIPPAIVLRGTFFHILANPEVLHNLKEELTTAIPEGTPISLQKLNSYPTSPLLCPRVSESHMHSVQDCHACLQIVLLFLEIGKFRPGRQSA